MRLDKLSMVGRRHPVWRITEQGLHLIWSQLYAGWLKTSETDIGVHDAGTEGDSSDILFFARECPDPGQAPN